MRPEPATRGFRTFQSRITIVFAATAFMTALVLSAVLAYTWEGQFRGYTRQNMQRVASTIASALSKSYSQQGGWANVSVESAVILVDDGKDIDVRVTDALGTVIYESGPAKHTPDGTDIVEGAAAVVSASIYDATGNKVGTLQMWARSSSALLTDVDAVFRANSYEAIVWAALIAVFIATIMGYFSSRSLARPIKRITSTAAQIRNGDLTARTGLSGDDEIGRLGETFDEMATSLERDIKHERRLTGDVAHELRTPLMAIQATVEAIQDGVLPADDEHLQVVDDEMRRLSRLVDAMLHLSRLETGKTKFHFEHADVVYLVRSLVSMQERLFHEHGLHLRFDDDKCPHHELYADVDPDGIREAVTNLMSNAMRYTPEGGWVLVSVSPDHDDVLIQVKDTGIGIAKEDIPRTFSRFWRSEASRARAAGGLGVGLAITKGIVDQHNGTISVESELGRGTTFTIRIPANQLRHGRKQSVDDV